jgi:LysR family hydrogen peroxide-inducible transcriptional activator
MVLPMQMHQLHYFLAVCAERSFTRAARRCGVAQPTLSRAIQRLETEFGGALFIRSSEGARLTPLGAAVQPHLAQIERSARAALRLAGAGATAGAESPDVLPPGLSLAVN